MRSEFIYTMTYEEKGHTVGQFLTHLGYSRRLIISLKQREDYLTMNGAMCFVNHRIAAGEVLHVKLPPEEFDERIVPSQMPMDIVYEDDDILVVNKAANVPIHPSQGHQEYTLANGLMYHFREKGEPFTFRVINRLDRDTTGLLIVARHALSACVLADQIRNRTIKRTYLAAMKGNLAETFPEGNGIVDAPIGRVDGSAIEREVNFETGESALTHVQLLSYDPATDTSLAELHLETGRTHQIRVHMKYCGHPLYGDFLYNPDYRFIGRQSLHSWKLEFTHPVTHELMQFTAPVPEDMRCFLKDAML
jgi:23S rRNA pseudouridine1911/1915/1917 synthase